MILRSMTGAWRLCRPHAYDHGLFCQDSEMRWRSTRGIPADCHPVFRANMNLTARLFAQDLELYRSLMASNFMSNRFWRLILPLLNESRTKLLSGCNHAGLEYLESIRNFLGPFCQQGLDESNAASRHLPERNSGKWENDY